MDDNRSAALAFRAFIYLMIIARHESFLCLSYQKSKSHA
jgi:hypothetical protein